MELFVTKLFEQIWKQLYCRRRSFLQTLAADGVGPKRLNFTANKENSLAHRYSKAKLYKIKKKNIKR